MTSTSDAASAVLRSTEMRSPTEILPLVPPYVAPANVWTQKVALLTKSIPVSCQALLDVVISRLPEPLFSQVLPGTYPDLHALLARIVQLEQGSPVSVAQAFFTTPVLTSGKKPSMLFQEYLVSARQLLPGSSSEALMGLAKMKTLAALPPAAQAIASLTPSTTPFEEVLVALDNMVSLEAPVRVSHVGAADQSSTAEAIQGTLNNVVDRLNTIEATVARVSQSPRSYSPSRVSFNNSSAPSSGFCWYHATFGEGALKCRPPCTWDKHASKKKNWRGAPSP